MLDMTDRMLYWVVSLSKMAQVLSVSYRAGFGHWNKVGLVTANSPGTVVSPQKFGWTWNTIVGAPSVSAQLTGTSPA